MIQTISVALSGPAHSFLLFETSKCNFGQEGFLLGCIRDHETQSITDNEEKQINVTRFIRINGAVPCPVLGYFYNNVGKIDGNKIKSFLGSQACNVIAWYRYSPISTGKLTLREKTIHIELANLFKIPQDLFSVCLLHKTLIESNSLLKLEQTFYRLKNQKYEALTLHVTNLQDKKPSYKSQEYFSPSFQSLIDKVEVDPREERGLVYATELQKSIQEHLKKLVEDLCKEEKKLRTLEIEVEDLLSERRQKESQLMNQSDIDEEMDNDFLESPCEILPFIGRINKDNNIARKLEF